MRSYIPGIGLLLVLAAVAVWWLAFKVKAGAMGVRAHRELLATDRYYRMLMEQAERDRQMGERTGYSEGRVQLYLLEHLQDTGKLTDEEFAAAASRVRATHGL